MLHFVQQICILADLISPMLYLVQDFVRSSTSMEILRAASATTTATTT